MNRSMNRFGTKGVVVGVIGLLAGCAGEQIAIPTGYFPPPVGSSDAAASAVLNATPLPPRSPMEKPAPPVPDGKQTPFDLSPLIPGAQVPPIQAPRFTKDTPPAERDATIRKLYPEVAPAVRSGPKSESEATLYTLDELQIAALTNNPRIRQALADTNASYGQVIQAGLHPNPTVGYQVDQWQPGLKIPPGSTFNGFGQQGGFINQLIKTAGKLTLARKVAGYDYINALVAVRKAQFDVTTQVRSAYFTALVAQQSLDVNAALANMADEVYRLQLKRVAAGLVAGYEPFQFHAQAVQARNGVAQAEATYKAAWKQLAAAIGQPNLPIATLAGRADTPAPIFDPEAVKARLLEQHTDLLTARNQIVQAQTNLTLQQRLPIPDIAANNYHQYDNAAQTYQFGLQFGVQLPISDRNQGNIRTARAKVSSAGENLRSAENDLLSRLAEAFGRYDANLRVAKNYREQILPDLTQAYRGIVRQYQADPDKAGFYDIVVAQQNLAQALQAYLSAIDAQWKAVVDLAALGQLEDLYQQPSPAMK